MNAIISLGNLIAFAVCFVDCRGVPKSLLNLLSMLFRTVERLHNVKFIKVVVLQKQTKSTTPVIKEAA